MQLLLVRLALETALAILVRTALLPIEWRFFGNLVAAARTRLRSTREAIDYALSARTYSHGRSDSASAIYSESGLKRYGTDGGSYQREAKDYRIYQAIQGCSVGVSIADSGPASHCIS